MLKTGDKTWNSFRGGRYTRNNLVQISDDHFLVANQIIFLGDGQAHKRPGYTLVQAAIGFNATTIFDFRRQSDGKQFVIFAGGGKIAWMASAGGVVTVLSTGEDATAVWSFTTNVFGLYGSNGINAYRFIDTGNGLLTKFKWGIAAPQAAPTVALAAGTLTLTYGRQYAFSYVSKWTDATGITRVHVGPPSPLSAFSGVLTSQVANLSNLLASADPQVTHIWVWSTNDTPANTTSVLNFNAEIANGVTTYGDSLADTSLDTTRQAPYFNQPPPAAGILVDYQGRIALSGIPGKPDLVQGTGLEEITLGIPQETAPPSVFFNVPGGIKKISAGKEFNQALMLSTELAWFQVQGFSAETFQEKDNIFEPGAAGKKLVCSTSKWMVWVSTDKKLWAWDGYSDSKEVSWKIGRSDGSSQLSMNSITDAQLANGQLLWFSFGQYSVVMLLISTANNAYFDWCQMWDVTTLTGPAGPYGPMTKDGLLMGAAEGDAFFSHHILGAGNVLVGSTQYLFMADDAGNVYRWPDGFTDAGNNYGPVIGSEYSDCDAPGLKKRFRWLDGITSRVDAATAFQAGAVVSDGVLIDQPPMALPIQECPPVQGVREPSKFRGRLSQQGTSVGRFIRWFVEFPLDDKPCKLFQVEVKASIVGKDTR